MVRILNHASLIRNKRQLIRNGSLPLNQKSRQLSLQALEEALRAVDPYTCLRSRVRILNERLTTNEFSISLSRFKRIMLVAAGKASVLMVRAAFDMLKDFPVHGILVAPKGGRIETLGDKVEIFRAGHPLPDRGGLMAAQRVVNVVREMKEEELLLLLISGGASAMLPAPPAGITLHDKRRVTELLLKRATAHEVNTVRRHLSNLKGGRLVESCRASTVVSLIISDNPGNILSDIASGLTVEDPTTYQNAVEILKVRGLWNEIPQRVRDYLVRGVRGEIPETPKPGTGTFRRVRNLIVADNMSACAAAKDAITMNHIPAMILTSFGGIEARRMGRFLGSTAIGCKRHGEPMPIPGALIVGGDTYVKVTGKGVGGRNQETALAAVKDIENLSGCVIATLGTDGVDGNSDAAGAIVDGNTAKRAKRKGINPADFLGRNDSYRFFRKLNDNLVTGPTGTNVADLYVMVSLE